MMILGLFSLLVFLLTSSDPGPSADAYEHRVYTELRKKDCRNLGGLCISKSKACPDDLPLDMVPGRPYCNRRHRCCHPVPTVDQCNGEYGFCIDKGDLCNGTVAEFYTSRNDHCTCCVPDILSFNEFISKFEKKYIKAEKKKRIKIFQENVEVMKYYNLMYRYGISSCLMGVNEYSDLTYEEVIGSLTGDISDLTLANETNEGGELRVSESYSSRYIPKDIGEEPKTMDYRDKGAVNPIRNQHKCGSCWAFSAVSTIESQIFLHTGRLVQLSEQNLVDCSKGYAFPNKTGWHGCAGGWKHRAIRYVSKYGIAYRDEYPFTAVEGLCNEDAPKNTYKVMGIQRVMPRSDAELLNALVNRGPIAVSIFVSANFVKYKRGILDDERCNDSKRPNHAMVLVGYGNENGTDYWLIRNSWGESWGEKGYIRLARKVENHCQISLYGFIPVTEVGTT